MKRSPLLNENHQEEEPFLTPTPLLCQRTMTLKTSSPVIPAYMPSKINPMSPLTSNTCGHWSGTRLVKILMFPILRPILFSGIALFLGGCHVQRGRQTMSVLSYCFLPKIMASMNQQCHKKVKSEYI